METTTFAELNVRLETSSISWISSGVIDAIISVLMEVARDCM